MSGIGPCLIFLFLAPIIFVALIAFDSAKKMKPEQDNSSICDNTRATELPSSSPIAKTDAYAVSALKKDRYNPNNKETRTLEFNRILSENNNESKRVAKKQKDYSSSCSKRCHPFWCGLLFPLLAAHACLCFKPGAPSGEGA